MAFSGTSYLAGIGTTVAAIAFGVACGNMITTSTVQPPNRLERQNAGTTARVTIGANSAPTNQKPASTDPKKVDTESQAQETPPQTAAADSQPAQDPPAAAAKADAATSGKPAPAASNPAPAAKSEDAAPVKSERASSGSPDQNRVARKRVERRYSDDRKSERRRRQDQDDRRLNEATNAVRQMPYDTRVDDVVGQQRPPRFGERPRRYELYDDDPPPRLVSEPPPRFFSFFGD